MASALRMREALAEGAGDKRFAALARGLDLVVALDVGVTRIAVRVSETGLTFSEDEPDIVIAAEETAWESACAAQPPPVFNAFTAVQLKNAAFKITGDGLLIAQARPALEALWSLATGTRRVSENSMQDLSGVTGRYARVTLSDGRATDMYYEEAGNGVPIVCLHTAGADSRQYHGQLADKDLTGNWRLIAFDLPAHGRTMAPSDPFASVYRLSAADYAAWVNAFLTQVVKRPAVLMGCSMGAAMVLTMAAKHPEQVLGVVALEAPLRARGRRNPFLGDARVNQGGHAASYVSGLMSPASPHESRARAAWIYAQGGPGIYDGDLVFYSEEFDGEKIAEDIDGARIPVAFLTGSYDYSATPEDSRGVAVHIQNHYFREMPGLGHFPMAENPGGFKPHLEAALAFVAKRLKDNSA